MSKPQHIWVNGVSYLVHERSGYVKADMDGRFGWTSVWAETHTDLVQRIKRALRGGQ